MHGSKNLDGSLCLHRISQVSSDTDRIRLYIRWRSTESSPIQASYLDQIYLFLFVIPALEVLPAKLYCFKLQTHPLAVSAEMVVFHKEIFKELGKASANS